MWVALVVDCVTLNTLLHGPLLLAKPPILWLISIATQSKENSTEQTSYSCFALETLFSFLLKQNFFLKKKKP